MVNSILFVIAVSYSASFITFFGLVKWIEYAENKAKLLKQQSIS